MVKSIGPWFIGDRIMRSGNWKFKQWCVGFGISGLIWNRYITWSWNRSVKCIMNRYFANIILCFQINSSASKIKLLFNKMGILLRLRFKLMLKLSPSDSSSYSDTWNHQLFTSLRFYLDKRAKDPSQNICHQKRKQLLNMIACQPLQIFWLPPLSTWMTIVLSNRLE